MVAAVAGKLLILGLSRNNIGMLLLVQDKPRSLVTKKHMFQKSSHLIIKKKEEKKNACKQIWCSESNANARKKT